MSETNRPRHVGRSIGAVFAGFVASYFPSPPTLCCT